MSKTKIAAQVLNDLRECGTGATRIIEGQRWVSTTLKFESVVERDENGDYAITPAQFQEALATLTARNMITADADRVFVRLGVLLSETATEEQPRSQPQPKLKEKTMSAFNVQAASMKELVAKFNELNPAKPVNKFADRKTAERRVTEALKAAKPATAPAAKKASGPAKPRTPKGEQVARTGLDAKYVRNGVRVNGGETYKSTAEAFRQLNLPMGSHIRFRGELKAAGTKTFEHGGKTYKFTVV